MKQILRVTAVFLLLIVLAASFAVFAEGGSMTSLTLQPRQAQLETGQLLDMVLAVEQTDLPVVGCALHLTLTDSYQFDSIKAGSDIEKSELSYSYDGSEIILLYMDDDLGGSPAGAGAQIAVISLAAVAACETAPLSCTLADVAGGDLDETVQMEADVSVGTAVVTGQQTARPAPPPHYVEAGGEEQPMAEHPAGTVSTPAPEGTEPPKKPENTVTEQERWAATPAPTAPLEENAFHETAANSFLQQSREAAGKNTLQPGLHWQWLAASLAVLTSAVMIYIKRSSHRGGKDQNKDP